MVKNERFGIKDLHHYDLVPHEISVPRFVQFGVHSRNFFFVFFQDL